MYQIMMYRPRFAYSYFSQALEFNFRVLFPRERPQEKKNVAKIKFREIA